MKLFIIVLLILILVIVGGLFYIAHFLFNGIADRENTWFKDVAHGRVNTDIDAEHDQVIVAREAEQLKIGSEFWDNADIKCQHKSFDNLILKGRIFLSAAPSKKWCLCFHGYRTDGKTDMGFIASRLTKMGFNCLVVDQRAHGESEGRYITMGWLERHDILSWTNYLIEQRNPEEIFWVGDSMGAATILMASGEDVPAVVHGLIADCGYTSIKDLFHYLLSSSFKVPNWVPIVPLYNLINKRKLKFNLNDASAYNQLKKNQLPLLIIHGDADTFVPLCMSQANLKATAGPKELVVVKGAPHFSSVLFDPDTYFYRIDTFFKKYSHN